MLLVALVLLACQMQSLVENMTNFGVGLAATSLPDVVIIGVQHFTLLLTPSNVTWSSY